ncbi:WEB family protein At4g27595, chloroplastic-like [Oryzias latipes]|uniref:WEB family protein At4g27595, chloroplastic-like n=1 Tax=Oryzias latipes TaxID=8090 RepID=UPI000CE1D36C|nr:WEB family protein At4g27595, chloroplastic-like [Oryzias latipes]
MPRVTKANRRKNPSPKLSEVLEELNTLKKAHENLIQDKKGQGLSTKVVALEHENAQLKKELEELTVPTDTKELREKFKNLKKEKEQTKEEHLTLKQANLDMVWELEECKAVLIQQMDITEKNEAHIKKLKQQLKDLKEQKAAKGGKGPKPDNNKAFEDLKRKYQESQGENRELKAENQVLVDEVEDLEKENADLNKKLEVSAQHESTIVELKEQLKTHEDEKRALLELNKLKEKEAEDAKRELEELKANKEKKTVSVQTDSDAEEKKTVSVQTDSVNQECITKVGETISPKDQTGEKTTEVGKTNSPDTENDGRAEERDGMKKDLQEIQVELSVKNLESREKKEQQAEVEEVEEEKPKKGKKVKRFSFTKFWRRLFCLKK